ncbi:methyltransferase [Mycena albidolilacea]|uniref:tRNA N(3)-methylcytidine methyltransferase n=1 Tax=Mycena albidolilacea TaxID=1033008 RepID=A0AAD6Z5W2_9AGAR|nr:methyltransferase [Mycena albidolilacea]
MDPQASTSTKNTSSVHDIASDKPPFGSRFLTNEAEVWSQNAWDHVPPPDDQHDIIAASLLKQRSAPVPEDDKQKYNERPARHWDNFYRMMASNFFRDRKWLHNEFRELMSATEAGADPTTILEVGCGTGAAMFPLLSSNQNPHLSLRAFDYSQHAVRLFQENPLYKSPPCGTISASVWDLTSPSLPEGVEPGSADILIMVFVFSALHPDEWAQAVSNAHALLKPNGLLLFRDYGRYDMAQLRFKGGRLLDENFYIRGDKTRVYFFELDELALLFTGARAQPSAQRPIVTQIIEDEGDDLTPGSEEVQPLQQQPLPVSEPAETAPESAELESATPNPPQIHPNLLSAPSATGLFTIDQLGVDRRLLLNRKRQVKMYRVWMQAKFRKLAEPEGSSS